MNDLSWYVCSWSFRLASFFKRVYPNICFYDLQRIRYLKGCSFTFFTLQLRSISQLIIHKVSTYQNHVTVDTRSVPFLHEIKTSKQLLLEKVCQFPGVLLEMIDISSKSAEYLLRIGRKPLVCPQTFSHTVLCNVCLTASNTVFGADAFVLLLLLLLLNLFLLLLLLNLLLLLLLLLLSISLYLCQLAQGNRIWLLNDCHKIPLRMIKLTLSKYQYTDALKKYWMLKITSS